MNLNFHFYFCSFESNKVNLYVGYGSLIDIECSYN